MSSNDDRRQQRIDVLEGHVTDEHLETIKNDETDTETDGNHSAEGVTEALSRHAPETLDDVDAMEAEIARLEEKLDALGAVLPEDRESEVRKQIEALQAATDAHSSSRSNTAEALASRIEVTHR